MVFYWQFSGSLDYGDSEWFYLKNRVRTISHATKNKQTTTYEENKHYETPKKTTIPQQNQTKKGKKKHHSPISHSPRGHLLQSFCQVNHRDPGRGLFNDGFRLTTFFYLLGGQLTVKKKNDVKMVTFLGRGQKSKAKKVFCFFCTLETHVLLDSWCFFWL